MKAENLFYLLISLLAPVLLAATASAATASAVRRLQMHNLAFASTSEHGNSFTIDFSAEGTGPGGIRFSELAFYDGEGQWRMRLGSNMPGKWSVRTVPSDPPTNRQS